MDRLLRARVLVAEAETLGVSINDLIAAATATLPDRTDPMPTVSQYLEVIRPTFEKGTFQTYNTYWRLAEQHLGTQPIDNVTVDDVEAVVVEAGRRAQARRPGSTGRSSRENCVAALRALFKRAKRARLVTDDPAAEIGKPTRLPSRRRALTEPELTEAIEAVRMCSRDLDLDLLLVEFHLESGARREGALNLTIDDLDVRRSTAWLSENFSSARSPASRTAPTSSGERRDRRCEHENMVLSVQVRHVYGLVRTSLCTGNGAGVGPRGKSMFGSCGAWRKAAGVALALSLVAVGCGGDSGGSSGAGSGGDGGGGAADPDATLTHLTASTLAAGFSPFEPNNPILDYQWQSLVYDGLFKLSPDLSGVEPALAREWEFSDDGLQLTITLQEGVKFQDGTDLTADVVVANLTAEQEEGSNGAPFLTSVSDVAALDPTTVQITLSEPDPTILFVLSTVTGIIVSEAGLADREALKAQPQGSGPYELVSSDAALNYRYEKWDGYWDEDYLADAPAVITVASVPDSTARANAMRTGDADYVFVETGQLPDVESDPNLQVVAEESISPLVLFFNNAMPPFDNPAAAQAINLGLDREAFDAVIDGGCPPAYQTFPEGLEGHLDGVTVDRDLEAAQQLVEDAGLKGSTILLENLDAGSNVDSARLFQPVLISQLEEIGFEVELGEPVDRSLSRTVWQEGGHAMVLTSTPSTVPSSSIYLDLYALGPNQVGTPDAELQSMQAAAKVLPLGSDERDAAYAEINQYLLNNPAYIPLCAPINVHVASARVAGLDEIPNRRVSQAGDFSHLRITG